MKKRVIVIGAGLCGSVVSTLLRNDFQVTVVEQGRKKKPLFDDVDCDTGELNTSINRAEGLGGSFEVTHPATGGTTVVWQVPTFTDRATIPAGPG